MTRRPATLHPEGRCVECDAPTDQQDSDDWLCPDCADIYADWQAEDQRLDDPRHGQAEELNRRGTR